MLSKLESIENTDQEGELDVLVDGINNEILRRLAQAMGVVKDKKRIKVRMVDTGVG